jgi:hypothetical protein
MPNKPTTLLVMAAQVCAIAGLWALCFATPTGAQPQPTPAAPTADLVLFKFDTAADAANWSNLEVLDPKTKQPKEPATKAELADDGGKKALKITFAGGNFPMVTNPTLPQMEFHAYKALAVDFTVTRPCLVGFRVRQEKGDFEKTEFLQPGTTTVMAALVDRWMQLVPTKDSKILGFDLYMWAPHPGEFALVSNIRLTMTPAPPDPPWGPFAITRPDGTKGQAEFKVLGTPMTCTCIADLSAKLKDKRVQQQSKSLAEIETDFRQKLEELKKAEPGAVLALLRDGEKAWDPQNADKVYSGWRDAYINGHGPDGERDRASKTGLRSWSEMFMRHRSRIMQVDVSSIPAGAKILAAQLVLTRGNMIPAEKLAADPHADTITKPNLWVAEACNREWDEAEVNAYQYAKDKFWKAISGTYFGDDPDFLPLFLAYGPSQGNVSGWDFTEAVKYWADGKNPNHGFFFHGDSQDYWAGSTPTRESENIKARPLLMVIYAPKP